MVSNRIPIRWLMDQLKQRQLVVRSSIADDDSGEKISRRDVTIHLLTGSGGTFNDRACVVAARHAYVARARTSELEVAIPERTGLDADFRWMQDRITRFFEESFCPSSWIEPEIVVCETRDVSPSEERLLELSHFSRADGLLSAMQTPTQERHYYKSDMKLIKEMAHRLDGFIQQQHLQ